MKKSIIFLFIFVHFLSCKKENSVQKTSKLNTNVEDPFKIPDSITEKSVFTKKNDHGFISIWVKSKESRGKYFYADENNILIVSQYSVKNNQFKKIKEIDLEKAEWAYLTIDSTNFKHLDIDKKSYFLLSSETSFMGNAVTEQNANFYAININNITENYNLSYTGTYTPYCESCIRGDFDENKTLNSKPKIKNALHLLANASSFIYHPSKEEKNISHYKNYLEKWAKDNTTENTYGAGYVIVPDIIHSTYYKENLFNITKATTEFTENENYKIQSNFRGSLIAYDKKKQLYFLIIAETCTLSCNKEVIFTNPNSIKITYGDGESYEIDLTKIIFK